METRFPIKEPSQAAAGGGRFAIQNSFRNDRGTTENKSAGGQHYYYETTTTTTPKLTTRIGLQTQMDSFPPKVDEHNSSKHDPRRYRSSPTTYEYDTDEEGAAARGFQTGAWDDCSVTSNTNRSRSNSWIDFTGDGILKDAAPVLPKLTSRKRYGLFVFLFVSIVAIIAAVVVGIILLMHPSTKSAAEAAPTPPEMQHGNSSQSPQAPQQQQEWLALGEVIHGKQQHDNFGRTLAISSDGSIFAASTEATGGGHNNYVQVYQFDNVTQQWVQLGHDFITTDQAYVDLAKNGTVLSIATIGRADKSTIGSVQLFAWSSGGGSWIQLGNTIVAPQGASSRYFGYETKISEDGSTVVVGDPGEGIATVYRSAAADGGTWTWIGQPLDTGITGDFYRCAISINYDGTIVAIGTWDNDRQKSLVRVYEEQQPEQAWIPRGSDIAAALSSENDNNEGKETRLSVSLSSDGNVIAIGDRFFDRLANEGMAQVLHYTSGSEWMPVGTPIVGTQADGRMGTSISLSADGGTFAVGVPMRMPREEGGSQAVGKVQVYQQQQERQGWVVGKTPETSDDAVAFGSYVALSFDGKTVAVADQYDKANGVYSGSVTVFRLTNTVA